MLFKGDKLTSEHVKGVKYLRGGGENVYWLMTWRRSGWLEKWVWKVKK